MKHFAVLVCAYLESKIGHLFDKKTYCKKKNNKMKIKHTQKECVFVKILRQISYYQIPQMNNESNFMVLL